MNTEPYASCNLALATLLDTIASIDVYDFNLQSRTLNAGMAKLVITAGCATIFNLRLQYRTLRWLSQLSCEMCVNQTSNANLCCKCKSCCSSSELAEQKTTL